MFTHVNEKFVQQWFAYPYVPPVTSELPALELSPGLFYPSAFESGLPFLFILLKFQSCNYYGMFYDFKFQCSSITS